MNEQNELSPGSGGPAAPAEPSSNPEPSDLLAPPGAGAGGPSAETLSPMMGHYGSAQDLAFSRFSKMQTSVQTLRAVRSELDSLMKLGDLVSQDDVIKSAGGLVAAGLGAAPIASLLADMPEKGEALQAWVAQHDVELRGREQQAEQALALTRHELGVAALHSLIGHSAEAMQLRQLAAAQPRLPDSNSLALPAPTAEPSNAG